MEKYWKENIRSAIQDIADLEFQHIAWMGKDPNLASSFIEVANVLLDDNCFADFIAAWESESMDSYVHKKMIELKSTIENYAGENKTHEEILNDPEWRSITYLAKSILDQWDVLSEK